MTKQVSGSNAPIVSVLSLKGQIHKLEWRGTLSVSVPRKGEVSATVLSVEYNGQTYDVRDAHVIEYYLSRGITRGIQDSRKTVEEAEKQLAANVAGFVTPAEQVRASRPAPIKAVGGKRGRKPAFGWDTLRDFLPEAVRAQLREKEDTERERIFAAILALAEDKRPAWYAEAVKQAQVAQEEAAKRAEQEALSLLDGLMG